MEDSQDRMEWSKKHGNAGGSVFADKVDDLRGWKSEKMTGEGGMGDKETET